MASRLRRQQRTSDIWPGFVDALSTLLLVIMFVLVVFMLAQYFLNWALSGADKTIDRLTRQVNELAELLSLEQQGNAELRLDIAQVSAQLQNSSAARDELSSQLLALQSEHGALGARLASIVTERDALELRVEQITERAALADAEAQALREALAEADKTITADRETIELRLAELASLRQDIAALRKVRDELEGQVGQLAVILEEKQGALDESRADVTRLDQANTALRDRSKELEARLSDEQERTSLAQKEIEKREVRLHDLVLALRQSDEALLAERDLSAETQAKIDLLNQQIALLRQELARIADALDASEAKDIEHQAVIADLGTRLNRALASKVQELQRYRSEFFGKLSEVLGDQPGIRVEGDRFVFSSEVLFASGSAVLGDEGRVQMSRLAETLLLIAAKIPDDLPWILRVDGHTDKIPIYTETFPSNWELSTARAISVVRYLTDQGVPPHRLAATGFGEFQPIDTHDDEIALRRNRRIELKLTTR